MEQLGTRQEEEMFLSGIKDEEDIIFLKTKLEEINNEEILNLPDKKIFYYAGLRRLYHLVNKLNPTDKKKFWKEFNAIDLIFDINNITYISKILMKFLFQTDCEVEALALIVSDYYNKIYKRIKRGE